MVHGYSVTRQFYLELKAQCVAERVTAFRPHVGAKSVPQELGASSDVAWRRRRYFVQLSLYAVEEF